MVRVCKNGRRSATRANFLENLAVRLLGKSTASVFLGRGHPKHSDMSEPVDQELRNVRRTIDRNRIQILIKKLAHLGERFVELHLLRGGNAGIWHRPIRNEPPKKKPLGKS